MRIATWNVNSLEARLETCRRDFSQTIDVLRAIASTGNPHERGSKNVRLDGRGYAANPRVRAE